MFTKKIQNIISNVVYTIGVKYIIPKGIGKVSWYQTDDEGKLQTNKFNNILYFTDSPFNVLITNALAEYTKYDKVTWVLTKRKYSIFTWYFGRYRSTMAHSKIVFHHYISKLDLAIFMDFEREWYQFQEITHLTLTFPPYSKRRIQEQVSKWILLQKLRV